MTPELDSAGYKLLESAEPGLVESLERADKWEYFLVYHEAHGIYFDKEDLKCQNVPKDSLNHVIRTIISFDSI
jgi:hypothetical protein